MSRMGAKEQNELVGLWRRLSPAGLVVELPSLRPDLESRSKLRLPRRPRAVLFDIYGTLLVSAAGGEPTMKGAHTPERDDARLRLEAELAGSGHQGGASGLARELSQSISEHRSQAMATNPQPEVDIEELLSELLPSLSGPEIRRIALLHEAAVNPCAQMPGARKMLLRLSASGLRLGVVSNAQFYTPLLLEALLGAPPHALGLEPQLSSYSYALRTAKPDTRPLEVVIQVLEKAGILPDETLFVGNSSTNDVAPARKLGLLTALFAGDSRSFRPSAPGTPGSLPDLMLTSLEELPGKILL